MTTSTNDTNPEPDAAPPDCQEEDVDNATPPTMPRRGRREWYINVYKPWWKEQFSSARNGENEEMLDALIDQDWAVEKRVFDKHELAARYWSDYDIKMAVEQILAQCWDNAANLPVFVLLTMSANNYTIDIRTASQFSKRLLCTSDRTEFLKYTDSMKHLSLAFYDSQFKLWIENETTHLRITMLPKSWLTAQPGTYFGGQKCYRLLTEETHAEGKALYRGFHEEMITALTQQFRREAKEKKTATPSPDSSCEEV
jgi:hypothetical protein